MLYIISNLKYLEYCRNGLIKYLPYRFLPNFSPRIIDSITRKGDIIGKIAGINRKPIDFNCDQALEEYIMSIKKIDIGNFRNLYLEEVDYIPKVAIGYMESSLGLKVSSSNHIRIEHIPLVVKKIYSQLNSDLKNKEVLVISRDKEIMKNIIKGISKDFKFITVPGSNPIDNEHVYDFILAETGLSLFHSSDINKILNKYNIIINLDDDFKLDTSKIRRNALFFDFTQGSLLNFKENNKFHRIKDFGFKLGDLDLDDNKWLEKDIDSNLYGLLDGKLPGDVEYLYLEKNCYTIKDYINNFIKIKGKL